MKEKKEAGRENCPAGFSTSTMVSFDNDGSCKCDCKLKKKAK
jgi:hypothetical protein